jgi:hypothetical protein
MGLAPLFRSLRVEDFATTPRRERQKGVSSHATLPAFARRPAQAAREVVAREGIGCLRRRLVRRPKVEARRLPIAKPGEPSLFTLQRSAQGDEFRFPKERAISRSVLTREAPKTRSDLGDGQRHEGGEASP